MNAIDGPLEYRRVPVSKRKELKTKRSGLSEETRHRAAMGFTRNIVRTPFYLASRDVAFYLPVRGELDVRPLMLRALAQRKKVYLPVVLDSAGGRMAFVHYELNMPLAPNEYGILEPQPSNIRLIEPTQLDLVITPLVGFDTAGNRLGMGGGYYDRTFRFLRTRRAWRKPKLVGAAYEFQRLEHIPTNDWDVPLWRIVTDERIYVPAGNSRKTAK